MPAWPQDADGEPADLDLVLALLLLADDEPIPFELAPTPLVLVYG